MSHPNRSANETLSTGSGRGARGTNEGECHSGRGIFPSIVLSCATRHGSWGKAAAVGTANLPGEEIPSRARFISGHARDMVENPCAGGACTYEGGAASLTKCSLREGEDGDDGEWAWWLGPLWPAAASCGSGAVSIARMLPTYALAFSSLSAAE